MLKTFNAYFWLDPPVDLYSMYTVYRISVFKNDCFTQIRSVNTIPYSTLDPLVFLLSDSEAEMISTDS